MNLYLGYLFAYTKNLNQYAVSLGWTPPADPALCRLTEPPQLEPFPTFERRRQGRRDDFEWDLTDFIRELRLRHNRDVVTVRRAYQTQLKFCVY
jgi:hypothetical protein